MIFLALTCGCLVTPVFSQNPFELKWREGSMEGTMSSPVPAIDSNLAMKPDERNPAPFPLHSESPPVRDSMAVTGPGVDTGIQDTAGKGMQEEAKMDEIINRKLRENPFEVTRILSRESIRKRKEEETTREEEIVKAPEAPVKDETRKNEVEEAPEQAGEKPITNVGFLAVFACVLLLLTFIVNMNRSFLKKIYKAVLNENYSSLLYRERKFSSVMLLYYMSYAIFFINGGLFLYLISSHQGWEIAEKNTLLAFIGLVTCVYIVRHLILNILSSIFPISREVNQYNFNILLFNILLGLILLPVNLLMAFGPEVLFSVLMFTGAIAVGGFYLMRQFRGFLITNRLIAESPFHFFVYLCTIEILPILILLKFF